MTLRPYQQECVDDVLAWVRTSVEPAVVEATVSFGKTRTIAAIAQAIVDMSGKKVLILCPTGLLAGQNAKAVGKKVSVFSSSLGQRSIKHDIVVGTPLTIKNHLSRFDSRFAAILIDEGEGLTKSVIDIVNQIRSHNKNLRVVGFTGTPYRTGTGFVYALDLDGKPVPDTQCIEPFYAKLIHQTDTKKLMQLGYLTPMVIGSINSTAYDTSGLVANRGGNFSKSDIAQCYIGRGRETAAIAQDIVNQGHNRPGQSLIFVASVDHSDEIMESLPKGYAVAIHGGKCNKSDLEAFKEGRVKAAVNVNMLTVGADFPRVDLVAMLRRTESERLLQQMLGRGIRLLEEVSAAVNNLSTPEARRAYIAGSAKPNCLYLDYTTDNAKLHYPDGDLWTPNIKARLKGEGFEITCICPDCGGENIFAGRKNDDGYEVDKEGYFVDLAGQRIESEYGPIPSHYGRRCLNMTLRKGEYVRCEYRYTYKECVECGEANDIAARRCTVCRAELVNPNEKLVADFRALKRDPYHRQTDVVEDWSIVRGVSSKGRDQYRINWQTKYRSFTQWVAVDPTSQWQQMGHDLVMNATANLTRKPETITYQKDAKSGFYNVYAFNNASDEEPEQYAIP